MEKSGFQIFTVCEINLKIINDSNLPSKISQSLKGFRYQGQVSVGPFARVFTSQVEEGRRQDGRTQVPQEDAGRDEVVTQVGLAHVLEKLADLVEATLKLDGEIGVTLGNSAPDLTHD